MSSTHSFSPGVCGSYHETTSILYLINFYIVGLQELSKFRNSIEFTILSSLQGHSCPKHPLMLFHFLCSRSFLFRRYPNKLISVFSNCRDKIDMAVRLFDALKMEAPSLRFVVQEATNLLVVAYKVCSKILINSPSLDSL